jgi:Neprosin/Neprosin activation peptide
MRTENSNRWQWITGCLAVLFTCIFMAGCDGSKKDGYVDKTGNHESPHPHKADIGKSPPESTKEPVRVRDDKERVRMKSYIEKYINREDVVSSIELSKHEVIDCVAMDKQPALRQPALKGHTIRLQPPGGPKEREQESPPAFIGDPAPAKKLQVLQLEYGTKGKVCSEKSVPVRRLTMEILDNFETLEDFFRARPPHALTGPTGLHQYANSAASVDNWGAQSTLNVWSPYTERASEFSLSQIAVVRGSGGNKETIEAGWQKYRDLYGDYRPRLFIYFTPDNYGSGGCYNLSCGAFVQVNNSIYIGGGFTNISAHPHPSTAWEFTVRWQRHGETGDWWLKYGNTWVGYYPSNLFDNNGLKPRGSRASFFGEIIDDTSGSRHTRTDMGSGHFPGDGFGYAAYQRRIRTITTSNVWNIRPSLSVARTDANCYDIEEHNSSGSWERYFYFGGPGFNTHCQ